MLSKLIYLITEVLENHLLGQSVYPIAGIYCLMVTAEKGIRSSGSNLKFFHSLPCVLGTKLH